MEEEPPTPPTPAQPSSPFWLPSSSTRPRHRFPPISGLVFNTSFFVVLLSVSAIVFLAVLTPSLLSYLSHAFHPKSIKKGWDAVNIFLVAFAVVCGFMGRKAGEDPAVRDHGQGSKDTATSTPRLVRSEQSYNNWYPYGVQESTTYPVRLRRNFSSYPDLRQEISWENDLRRPRYYDDSYVDNYNSPRLESSAESFRSQKVDGDSGADVINLEVAALGKHSSEDSVPPPSPPAAPQVSLISPVPDLSVGDEDLKQENQRTRRRGRRKKRMVAKESQSPPVRTKTPSPPPPSQLPEGGELEPEEESARSTPKKRGGMTKEIISSIYHQSKRKKNQKRRSYESLEDFVHTPNPNPSGSIPQPPPPPPPPPSFFHNIFSTKKVRSAKKSSSAPPAPPLPPRRRSSASHSVSNVTKSKTKFTSKPTTSRTDFHRIDLMSSDGSESPLIPIPPPPPPPPFKFRPWKFAVEGDYINIARSPKSGDGDSEIEDSDGSTPMASGNAHPSFSCPSPDVNHKADDFIARIRANMKLEKMNSIKQKKETGIGFSPLGPESSPSSTSAR